LPDLILIDGGRPQIERISKLFQTKRVTIPFAGISKYQNDKLIFPKNTKTSFREMVVSMKETLLRVREESHRFAIFSSRRKRGKPFKIELPLEMGWYRNYTRFKRRAALYNAGGRAGKGK